MSKSIFYSILFFLFITPFFGSSFAQDNEAIVMFLPDVVTLPPGESIAELEEAAISDGEVEMMLYANNVQTLRKAFPNFQLSDTLGLTLNGDTVRFANLYNIYVLQALSEEDVLTMIEELEPLTNVVFVESNAALTVPHNVKCSLLPNIPDDPFYVNGAQWNLNNYGQNQGTVDADIDAPEAWELTTGNSSTKIAIVDFGTTYHPDLRNTHTPSYSAGGHGFQVSGIAGANTDNSTGIAGIDWNAQLTSYNITGLSPSDVMSLIDYIRLGTGTHYSNHSYGFTSDGTQYGEPVDLHVMRLGYSQLFKKGIVSFSSIGNTNTSVPYYPAGYDDWVIAVGSMDKNMLRSSFSNTGGHLDFIAPGEGIISCAPGSAYILDDGTSFASPHGTGVAGLLRDYFNSLYGYTPYPSDVEKILENSAFDIPPTGRDNATGHGLLKARASLDYISYPNKLFGVTVRSNDIISVQQVGTNYDQEFYGINDLKDGQTYNVTKHLATFNTTFNLGFLSIPDGWCRKSITKTLSSDPTYTAGYFDMAILSNSTLEAYAYFYHVNIYGNNWKWFPYDPYNTLEAPEGQIKIAFVGKVYPDAPVIAKDNTSSYAKFNWQPISGSDIDYYIERKVGTGNWTFLASTPNTQYTDYTARVIGDGGSKYIYRVRARNYSGTLDYYSNYSNTLTFECRGELWKDQGSDEKIIPDEYELLSNYPNPFNPSTTITFGLPEDASVLLTVYNALGELVAEPVNETMQAGYHSISWNASDLPSGVYIYKINANEFSAVKKMLLTK